MCWFAEPNVLVCRTECVGLPNVLVCVFVVAASLMDKRVAEYDCFGECDCLRNMIVLRNVLFFVFIVAPPKCVVLYWSSLAEVALKEWTLYQGGPHWDTPK